MRRKPKDTKTTIPILAVAIAKQAGFTNTYSAVRIGYRSQETRSRWSASYLRLDGILQKTIRTEDGTIDAVVETAPDGPLLFRQDHLESGAFTIEAPSSARIRIEANAHKGSFDIRG